MAAHDLRRRWRRRYLTRAVECRRTSSPKSSFVEGPSLSMATATAPTSPVGKLMVVSGGATMAAIGTSSNPMTLRSSGNGDAAAGQAGDHTECHLVVEREDGRHATGQDLGHDDRRGLEGGLGHAELEHLHPARPAGAAAPRCAAPPPPTTRSVRRGRPAAYVRDRPGAAGLGHGRRRPQQNGRVLADGAVDEDRRRGSQGRQRAMEAAGRHDDEPVDLPGQRLRCPHLFVRMLAGVHQQHLQIALPGRPLHRSHQGARSEGW